jgi:hypothetical protein
MPNPNAHDQPVEGGVEQVERALQKQNDTPQNKRPSTPDKAPKDKKMGEK